MLNKKMKKSYGFSLLTGVLLFSQFLFAQQKKDSSSAIGVRSYFKLTAYIYSGIEWEQKIGKISTINLFGGIGIRAQSDKIWDSKAKTIIEPDTYVEYRNYYNYYRRIAKQKKMKNNSANFLFFRIDTFYPIKNQNFFNLLFMQGWGGQRTLWKKISVNCHLGIIEHVYYDAPPDGGFNYVKLEPLTTFSFMYAF